MAESDTQQSGDRMAEEHHNDGGEQPRDSSGNPRGFAAMNEDKQRQIAAKGGAAVSRNREYMAAIGRKGGERVSQDREHMSNIGRKGGQA